MLRKDWYSSEVVKQLSECSNITSVDIDMKLSRMKPLHAYWLVQSISKLENDRATLKRGWSQAGIQDC